MCSAKNHMSNIFTREHKVLAESKIEFLVAVVVVGCSPLIKRLGVHKKSYNNNSSECNYKHFGAHAHSRKRTRVRVRVRVSHIKYKESPPPFPVFLILLCNLKINLDLI